MKADLQRMLESVNAELAVAEQRQHEVQERMRVLRDRQTAIAIWISEEDIDTPAAKSAAQEPKKAAPVKHFDVPTFIDRGPESAPARVVTHKIADEEPESGQSLTTRAQIVAILKKTAEPVSAGQIFELGQFEAPVQVAAELSVMTLKKGWLDRKPIPNPDPKKAKKGYAPTVFGYTLKADAQIPETVSG